MFSGQAGEKDNILITFECIFINKRQWNCDVVYLIIKKLLADLI
jgi:hypothetical protein